MCIRDSHSIDLHANGPNINKIGNTVSWSGNGTRIISGSIQGENLNQSSNSFFIQNNSTDNNSSPYIDYLKIKYGRKLIFDSNIIEFFSPIKGANIRFNFDTSLPENVWRAKGFTLIDDKPSLLQFTMGELDITPVKPGHTCNMEFIGSNMDQRFLSECFNAIALEAVK